MRVDGKEEGEGIGDLEGGEGGVLGEEGAAAARTGSEMGALGDSISFSDVGGIHIHSIQEGVHCPVVRRVHPGLP